MTGRLMSKYVQIDGPTKKCKSQIHLNIMQWHFVDSYGIFCSPIICYSEYSPIQLYETKLTAKHKECEVYFCHHAANGCTSSSSVSRPVIQFLTTVVELQQMFVYMYVTAGTGRQPKCSKQINNNNRYKSSSSVS